MLTTTLTYIADAPETAEQILRVVQHCEMLEQGVPSTTNRLVPFVDLTIGGVSIGESMIVDGFASRQLLTLPINPAFSLGGAKMSAASEIAGVAVVPVLCAELTEEGRVTQIFDYSAKRKWCTR